MPPWHHAWMTSFASTASDMPRVKHFIDSDVLTEAKRRIKNFLRSAFPPKLLVAPEGRFDRKRLIPILRDHFA